MEIQVTRSKELGSLPRRGMGLTGAARLGFGMLASVLGTVDCWASGGAATELQRIERELFEPYHRYRHLD